MSSVSAMDKKAEQKLIDAVRCVSGNVAAGDTPTEAVVKAARDMQLGEAMVPLVVQAYNIGRTTYQRESNNNILDKQADFPIAHLEEAMSQIYPDAPPTPGELKVATSVSSIYDVPAFASAPESPGSSGVRYTRLGQEKASHVSVDIRAGIPEPPKPVPCEKLSAINRYLAATGDESRREEKRANGQAVHARERLLSAMGRLTDYFKQADHLPFAEVEYNAAAMFGSPAVHALTYAYTQGKLAEKRAAEMGPPKVYRPVDVGQPPYSLLKQAIDCGAEAIAANANLARIKRAQEAAIAEASRPFVEPTPPEEKSAGLFQNLLLGANLRASTAKTDAGLGKTPDQAAASMADGLNDPSHIQDLRAIRTQAMLGDFLNNDDVISGYDPDEVSEAFNDISSLSPNAAMQPAIMRPLLRKRLTQGAVEPFEAEQLANIEKTVAENKRGGGSPGLAALPSGPEKISQLSEVLRGSSVLT